MRKQTQRVLLLVMLLLLVMVVIAGCEQISPDDLSREAGREARQGVEVLLEQLGEFVAGFCAASALPVAMVSGAAVLSRSRRQR